MEVEWLKKKNSIPAQSPYWESPSPLVHRREYTQGLRWNPALLGHKSTLQSIVETPGRAEDKFKLVGYEDLIDGLMIWPCNMPNVPCKEDMDVSV